LQKGEVAISDGSRESSVTHDKLQREMEVGLLLSIILQVVCH